MRRLLKGAIGTSQYDVPGLADNAVVIGAENLEQIPFENVLRAYMAKSSTATSLYQAYVVRGEGEFCGHELPEGLFTNGPLPYVMDTPSTKSDEHDLSVSPMFLFNHRICTPAEYEQIRNGSILAMGIVSELARQKGMIAVDTKTEHGRNNKGEIVAQDELWTMDSSRFWLAQDYADQLDKFLKGEIEEIDPRSYSKEFARGFSKGKEGYDDETRAKIAVRYIEGIQHLLGKRFVPDMRSREERVVTGLQTVVDQLAN
jgi:phosphoribosylaminoimidazole-succinocarboxamide synthase